MALCGATAVLVPDHIVWMPRFLAQFVRESRISCWYSVPSILARMLREGRMAEHSYPDLRLILFAGEVFPAPALARLQAAVPNALCANLYGPTETNVVTWCRVPTGFDGSQPLPIGHPCPYAEVRIDECNGELLAGGDSLMRGYWNRPDETESHFVLLDGIRYYRTGDHFSGVSIARSSAAASASSLERSRQLFCLMKIYWKRLWLLSRTNKKVWSLRPLFIPLLRVP
jgi:non-ribosomal peptide synthetase component F